MAREQQGIVGRTRTHSLSNNIFKYFYSSGLLLEWAQLKYSGYTAEEVNMVISLLSTHSVKYQPGGGGDGKDGRAFYVSQ